MVQGLPAIAIIDEPCTKCITSKHHHESMSRKSFWRASQVSRVIHAEICGPITLVSYGNNKYILCFIDDHSRRSWIYFLFEKCEALNHFKCFKKKMENEVGLSTGVCEPIREESLPRQNSTNFMRKMALKGN